MDTIKGKETVQKFRKIKQKLKSDIIIYQVAKDRECTTDNGSVNFETIESEPDD